MTGARALYLDDGPGERRAVVTLDGLPERLLIERDEDAPAQQPGARVAARVRRVERALNTAFLDLGVAPDAVLALGRGGPPITDGAWLEVEIVSAARGEKGASARVLGVCEGPIRLIASPPAIETRVQAYAPGSAIIGGSSARAAAEIAEETALAVEHPLRSGGRLFIEPTQALTAIDVDLGSAAGDARKAAVRANKEAIAAAARLLRLKGLGGLVAIDLAGKGHDGAALSTLAKAVFAPDGAGVSIGSISRFGVLELALPRRERPVAERLLGSDGEPTAVTMALRLLRRIENFAGPGQFVDAVCAPEVAVIAERLSPRLTDRIGPRFAIRADALGSITNVEVTAR